MSCLTLMFWRLLRNMLCSNYFYTINSRIDDWVRRSLGKWSPYIFDKLYWLWCLTVIFFMFDKFDLFFSLTRIILNIYSHLFYFKWISVKNLILYLVFSWLNFRYYYNLIFMLLHWICNAFSNDFFYNRFLDL